MSDDRATDRGGRREKPVVEPALGGYVGREKETRTCVVVHEQAILRRRR